MSENSCEYIVKQKTEGIALAKKIGMIAAYAALALTLSYFNLTLAPVELRLIFFVFIILISALSES